MNNQQYAPNPGMTPMMVVQPHGERDWSNDLCGCECGTCIFACCCPCCLLQRNNDRIDNLRNGKAPSSSGICGCTCISQAILAGIPGLHWILPYMSRGTARSYYRIRGGGCGDFCTACCCQPCLLTQVSREIGNEMQAKGYGH